MNSTLRIQQLSQSQSDVFGDLPKQGRGDVAALVEGDCGATAVGVAKLLVRALLADFDETVLPEELDDLGRGEDRDVAHGLSRPSRAGCRRTRSPDSPRPLR